MSRGVSKAYKDLVIRVGKFKAGLEVTFNGKSLGTDLSERWARKVENISKKVLQRGAIFLEEIANWEGDPLKPLRRVLERVVELAQLVEGFELELSEAEVRSISRELSWCKGKVQSLTRSYLVSDHPSLAAATNELTNEADKVIGRGARSASADFFRGWA